MKPWSKISAVFLVCALATFVSAGTLTGTVKNGTTNQPSAGDDVVPPPVDPDEEHAEAPRHTASAEPSKME